MSLAVLVASVESSYWCHVISVGTCRVMSTCHVCCCCILHSIDIFSAAC